MRMIEINDEERNLMEMVRIGILGRDVMANNNSRVSMCKRGMIGKNMR